MSDLADALLVSPLVVNTSGKGRCTPLPMNSFFPFVIYMLILSELRILTCHNIVALASVRLMMHGNSFLQIVATSYTSFERNLVRGLANSRRISPVKWITQKQEGQR